MCWEDAAQHASARDLAVRLHRLSSIPHTWGMSVRSAGSSIMWSPWLVMLVYSRLLSFRRLRRLGSNPSSSSCITRP